MFNFKKAQLKQNGKEIKEKKRASWKEQAKEWIEVIVTAAILALVIRTFVIQAYKIPSGSMIPTLEIKDHLFVWKFAYWFKEPKSQDIIVFKYPLEPKKDFIKRVIACPGDEVEIINKQVYVNGQALEEPYKYHEETQIIPAQYAPRDNYGPKIVPKDSFFVLGDNRDKSLDSRYWGFVSKSKIKGMALFIYWPPWRIRLIK